jgi:hypothetical protein
MRGPLPTSRRKPAQRSIEVVEVLKDENTAEQRIEIRSLRGSRLTVFGAWTASQIAELVRSLEEER